MDKITRSRLTPWVVPAVLVCAAFIFFQWCYPYHLFRREQTMLFLFDSEYISRYFSHDGWLAALSGDFLTQFFYYVGVGATIISLLLGVLWVLVWLNAKACFRGNIMPIITATGVFAWEWLRQCGEMYTTASTISLIGAFALLLLTTKIHHKLLRPLLSVVSIALCCWCFGYSAIILAALIAIYAAIKRLWPTLCVGIVGIIASWAFTDDSLENVQWWGAPNFSQEHKLAIDCEAYFGNREKVLQLSLQSDNTRYASFYYYLINALKHNLPDAVLTRMPKDADGLLPSMDPTKNSLDLSALGEAWYYMGDMTSSEHCTIVAMISSTRHTGSRYIKRMAEINLANGDTEAAMKYLRMLSKTLCHAKWAESRMPQHESESARALREDIGRYITATDTVRYVNDYTKTLRHLVKNHPDNDIAYDFLLCRHLLQRDIKAFIEDLDSTRPLPRLYQEAVLIYLSIINASPEEIEKYDIPESTFEDFYNFNQMMSATDGSASRLASRFGNTYWYFYQIPQK